MNAEPINTGKVSLDQRLEQLQPRERILLLAALLAVVYLFAELLFLGPASTEYKAVEEKLSTARASHTKHQQQLSQFLAEAANNPNTARHAQIQALEQQVEQLQNELSTIAGGMVSAQDLPRILEDVLAKTGKLTLRKLRALPVEELQLTATNDKGEPLKAGVYKHGVQVQLEGSFFEVVRYMEALEQLPWGFKWDQLNYKTGNYPNAEVSLRVYTLTAEEGLFGEP